MTIAPLAAVLISQSRRLFLVKRAVKFNLNNAKIVSVFSWLLSVLAQRLGISVDYFSRIAIQKTFFIPILPTVNETAHHIPLTGLPIIIISLDDLPHYFASAIAMFRMCFQVFLDMDRFSNRYVFSASQ